MDGDRLSGSPEPDNSRPGLALETGPDFCRTGNTASVTVWQARQQVELVLVVSS
jgi:hypothetical protein